MLIRTISRHPYWPGVACLLVGPLCIYLSVWHPTRFAPITMAVGVIDIATGIWSLWRTRYYRRQMRELALQSREGIEA